MTKRLLARSRAKVNLALHVIRKRKDGYHEIETIFQSVNLYDELDIEFTFGNTITVSVTDPDIPSNQGNLCYRALVELQNLTGVSLGAHIHINKNIPHASGLGGGSSNAAAVLLAANRAAALGLTVRQLEAVGTKIGSDVPFMLHGGTMLGRGRGEELIRLESLSFGHFLIVKPPIDISTAWVYENYNFRLTKHRYRINLKAVNATIAHFPKASLSFNNALEDVVCPAYPQILAVLEELLATKPLFASMSGSGSALYAIFEDEAKASRVAERFSVKGYFTAVVEPTGRAVDFV